MVGDLISAVYRLLLVAITNQQAYNNAAGMPVRAERDYENLPGIPIMSATAARRY